MAFIKCIAEAELKNYATLEEVNFESSDSVIGKIFRYIMKSQKDNMDTLCCIAAHMFK